LQTNRLKGGEATVQKWDFLQSFSVVAVKQKQIIADGSLSVSSYFPSRESRVA